MQGVLRFGVSETIVHTWLPRLIKNVNTAYPNLSLEIEVDITPNLRARLLAQEIDRRPTPSRLNWLLMFA